MNKKTLVLSSLAIVSFGATLATVFASKSSVKRLTSSAATNYTLTLDATSLAGASGSGSAVVSSSNGGQVQFDYTGLTIDSGKLVFENGATLLNPRLVSGDNNYISGVQLVALTFDENDTGSFALDYTWGESLLAGTPYYQRRGYVVSSSFKSYGFLGERPNFLRFSATAASTIESLTITYSCSRDVEEPSDNLVLNTPTQFEQFKTVVNRGNSFSGQTVELGSDIDLSLLDKNLNGVIGATNDTPFSGTFDGKNHKVSNYEREGSDSVALFSRVTDGTIKNLVVEGVNVSSTGQRSAGVVARAINATLNNVSVTSGTISGTKQNGGIVAYSEGATTLTNCSNAASVSGSSDGNGGLVGVYSNASDANPITITNCTNSGALNCTSAGKYNGGILGYVPNGAVVISGCVNSGSITSQAEGTAGIVGYLAGVKDKSITDCENTGTINGKGNGTAGILAQNAEFATPKVHLTNCVNRGTIIGVSYVGGIAGLARGKNSTGSKGSSISGCNNFGNISGTSVSIGGVAGCARYNVVDCGCYYNATIARSSAIKTAAELSMVGEQLADSSGGTSSGIGYLVGTQGWQSITTVSGSLLEADGTVHSI